MLRTGNPFTTNGKMVVSTGMHDWSTTPGLSTPPPVTRHVTGCAHSTEAEQELGDVVTALPLLSNTHGTVALAIAVPVTVTLKLAPSGHVTSTVQTIGPELWPAGIVTVAGIGL